MIILLITHCDNTEQVKHKQSFECRLKILFIGSQEVVLQEAIYVSVFVLV